MVITSQPAQLPARATDGSNSLILAVSERHLRTSYTTTVLRPFFQDHPGEPVPEENFWTLWCKGRLTEADTSTIRLGATPSGLSRAHLHHTPIFFTGRMPFLPPNQQCQGTEGNLEHLTVKGISLPFKQRSEPNTEIKLLQVLRNRYVSTTFPGLDHGFST